MATTTNAQTFTIGGVTHQVEDTTARAGVSALQTALASLQSALDTLMGTDDITDEIDTYNEIKEFLDGFDVDDPNLSEQLTTLFTNVNDLMAAIPNKASVTQVNNLQTAVTNLQTALANKVDAVNGKGLSTEDFTAALKAKLEALDPYTKAQVDAAIQQAVSGLESVSVTTNQDGTFTIHVGETDYTINLNHTHENMCRLVRCEESDVPSNPLGDTIYAVVDNDEQPTEIVKLIICGIEFVGGATMRPILSMPSNGDVINVDELVSGALTIKGYNLTANLDIAVTGDFTVNGGAAAVVSFDNANAGTTVTLSCTSQVENASGTLTIQSGNNINVSCVLRANVPHYEVIEGVKFTGTQWVKFGFDVGPDTSFDLDIEFAFRSSSEQRGNITFYMCEDSASPNAFQANNEASNFDKFFVWVNSSYDSYDYGSLGRGTWQYTNGSVEYRGHTFTLTQKASTNHGFTFGYDYSGSKIYNGTNATIRSLKVYEDGVMTHDFEPRKLGSRIGMLDLVTENFVTSETSTELEELITT